MNRALKWFARIFLVVVALLAVASVTTLTTVGHTPRRALPGVAQALTRLQQASPAVPLVFGELHAGMARARLTPVLGGSGNDPAHGRFQAVPLAGGCRVFVVDGEAGRRWHCGRGRLCGPRDGVAVTVTSFNGDYVGYVIPAKYYALDGYEPRTMSFYGPELAGYFMDVFTGLTARLANP